MDIQKIFDFILKNSTVSIFIITASVALLSTSLSLLEYFREKAFYDYFYIDNPFRHSPRSGFHPEYLLRAAICLVTFTIVLFVLFPYLEKALSIYITCSLLVVLICVITYLLNCFVYTFQYNSYRDEMHHWDKKEFSKARKSFAKYKALQWLVMALIFSCFYLFLDLIKYKNAFLIFSACVLLSSYTYFKLEYYFAKKMLKYKFKTANTAEINGEFFLILSTNNNLNYCVKFELEEETCIIYLDEKIVLKTDTKIKLKKIYFKSYVKIINGHKI